MRTTKAMGDPDAQGRARLVPGPAPEVFDVRPQQTRVGPDGFLSRRNIPFFLFGCGDPGGSKQHARLNERAAFRKAVNVSYEELVGRLAF